MLKKRNLIFLSLLILGVLLLTSCFIEPPITEGILKGQVIVPEGYTQTKDLTGQALPDATVNIIDLSTGGIIATTTTDANGYYQVFVPAGGPYLLQAVKDGVKIQQFTPQVEAGIEYDLGTANCSTTAVALIAQAMMDAEDYPDDPTDINLANIEADPNFNDVVSIVCSTIEAGEDPTESTAIEQAVEDFLSPPVFVPNPVYTPTYTVTYDGNGSTGGTVPTDSSSPYENGATVTVLGNTGTLVRTGYAFAGWNTQADGNGTDRTVGSTFIMGTADVTLYAKWTINTYTVTYDGNGSTGGTVPTDSSSPYENGATVTVLGNTGTLVRTGYAFAGWNTQADGNGTDRTVGSTFIMGTADVTLYAKWTNSVHNITRNTYYAVIQAALDDANSGDTIEIADGTYSESITFPSSKVIILQSVNGALSTIIQGNNGSDTVTFNGSLTGTILEGFTINHDDGMTGRGVFVNNSNLTINECTISGNTTDNSGGGIYNHNYSTLTVTSSTISGNSAVYGFGGGIHNYDHSTLTVTSSTISGNSADTGGGIDNYTDSTLTITSSNILDNIAADYGGGIDNYYSTLTITSSTISGNNAYTGLGYGGGICNWYGTLTITSSTNSDNIANYGGGIYNYSPGNLSVTSSTISGNNVSQQGGGIYLADVGTAGTITIGGSSPIDTDNNTFTDNKKEDTISAEQHIRDTVGDCHWDYLNNDYSPAEVTSYKFLAINNSSDLTVDVEGDINPTDRTISLTVPSGTDVTGLIATFTLVTGASAKVGTTSQTSGTTSNDFTSPVVYTVSKTIDTTWTMTVTIASP